MIQHTVVPVDALCFTEGQAAGMCLATCRRRCLKFWLRLYRDHVLSVCSGGILRVRTYQELEGRVVSVVHRIVQNMCMYLDCPGRVKLNHLF